MEKNIPKPQKSELLVFQMNSTVYLLGENVVFHCDIKE